VTFYLDTSFLISVLADEANSDASRAWMKSAAAPMIVSDFAALEFAASMLRFLRAGRLSDESASVMLQRFDQIRAASVAYAHAADDYRLADELVRDFRTKLAAPDSLHLASSIKLGATLVTFDERLAAAARMRGAEVLTPG
jgi:uncharacterized protein